jgi:hypothetical protein
MKKLGIEPENYKFTYVSIYVQSTDEAVMHIISVAEGPHNAHPPDRRQ